MQTWKDTRLTWNESKYEGVSKAVFPVWRVFAPNLELVNHIDFVQPFSSNSVLVHSNGNVTLDTEFQLGTYCDLDYAEWPFDSHACQIDLEKTQKIAMQLRLTQQDLGGQDRRFINSQWKIRMVNISQAEVVEDLFTLKVVVERQTSGLVWTLFAPVTVIVLLTLCGFWLPVQAGEKILLNGIVGVLINMFLLHFSAKLTTMGTHTPLVVRFCCFTLYMIVWSMVLSILVLAISRTHHNYGTPWVLKRIVDGPFGQFMLLSWLYGSHAGKGDEPSTSSFDVRIGRELRADDEEEEEEGEEADNQNYYERVAEVPERKRSSAGEGIANLRNKVQQDWIALATLIDRITFVVYSLIFVVIAIVYKV